MKTKRDISTISYNTQDYLIMKLDELIEAHNISFYIIIGHKAEEDEKKDHFHVFIRPNGQLDTMDLQAEFREFDPNKPNKPLGCIQFEYSKIDDWILYNEHYEPYLASKLESRVHHYTKDHFVSSDEDSFEFYYNHAFTGSEWAKKNQILAHLKDSNLSPSDLIEKGVVPMNMASQLNAYLFMKNHYGTTERGNHNNHEEVHVMGEEEIRFHDRVANGEVKNIINNKENN